MEKLTRYDIDAEINLNGEAYHFRDRNMHSGEYVLYSELEELGYILPKHETVEDIIKKADDLIDFVILKANRKRAHYADSIACLSLSLRDAIANHHGKPEA